MRACAWYTDPMFVNQEQLKEFLIDAGLLSRKDAQAAEREAKERGAKLDETLVARGVLSADEVRRAQAYVLGIPFVSLTDVKIPFEVLTLIPEPIARKHNIVAYRKTPHGELEVAMLDTDDLRAIEFVKKKTGLKILPRLTDEASLKSALRAYQRSLQAEFGDFITTEAKSLTLLSEGSGEETDAATLEKHAQALPVVRIVNALLTHALLQGASDIHIEPQEQNVVVRYRIDGILHDVMTLPKDAAPAIVARIKVLANLKLDEKRLPQDGRFKMEIEGEKVSFRVSILPVYFGEKVVMRLLREGGGGFTLESLGFHGVSLERMHEAMRQKIGMILVTGPTGSGKSTTLYTILDQLNTPDVNISTIEDPIEYQMPRINQTQVNPQIGFSFATGLRALMRQDPDIMMVGEIRDHETASLAVNAALTGHLVLSTLHTNTAAAAFARLIDMGVEPFLLVSTLKVVVGQRLVRRLIKEEAEQYTLPQSLIKELELHIDADRVVEALAEEGVIPKKMPLHSVPFFRPREGAEEGGYKGRIGIHEVLKVTPGVQQLVMEGKDASTIELTARKEGMLTMLEDGIFKAAQGVTTVEEVLRVISE